MNCREIKWISSSTTRIHSGRDLATIPQLLAGRTSFLLVDRNFWHHHGPRIPMVPDWILDASEANKTLGYAETVYRQLQNAKADRHTVLIALGGGITTDLGAFVGSTYMRGMPVILGPTTLLAQVDAATGGKTGVNFGGLKNAIGSFHQPEDILLDYETLVSLPDVEFRNGMAETIKHASIADPELLDRLECDSCTMDALRTDHEALRELVDRSINIKLNIVQQDVKEAGLRKILNFGHTIGHAVELAEAMPHGSAVAIGMVMAARLSEITGIAENNVTQRLQQTLARWGLPTATSLPVDQLVESVRMDKKKHLSEIDFVLLKDIGKPLIHVFSISELEDFIRDMCQYR